MSSIISHAAIPIAVSAVFPTGSLSKGLLLAGALCAMVPDLDVIGFYFGVRYSDMLGHRGLSHSIAFALGLSALLAAAWPTAEPGRLPAFLFLFLATLSHPFLDAFTDGGLGVAWFAPFSNQRYFFPWRPLAVPPIGIEAFFTTRDWHVLKSEFVWVWLPSLCVFASGLIAKRF
jgi:inner membrane protein